jgi:sortase (surface protein transpeptidase)
VTSSGHGRHRARSALFRQSWSRGPASFPVILALALFFPGTAGPAAGLSAGEASSAAEARDGSQAIVVADGSVSDEAAAPIRVRIPSIDVDSPLASLGVDDQGALVPPADFARAGWFSGSPLPGDVGPSVIAGHVDSYEGPAVFFRLRDLAAGDMVLVERADGTTARFTVSRTGRHPKDVFPSEDVYGPTPRAELRLITCGGEFDHGLRSYLDNVVVHAVLTAG